MSTNLLTVAETAGAPRIEPATVRTMDSPVTLKDHSELYRTRLLDGGDSVTDEIDRKNDRILGRLEKPFEKGNPRRVDRIRYFDFTGDPTVARHVLSGRAAVMTASGEAIQEWLIGKHRILDLGCSTGLLTTWYARSDQSRLVTGVDFSPRCIRTARWMAKKLAIQNVSFELCDIEQGIPGQDYDAIVESQSLAYVKEDPKIIRRLRRALSPGGILISVPRVKCQEQTVAFLDLLRTGGLEPTSFSMIYWRFRGILYTNPLIVAEPDGKPTELDVEAKYEEASSKVCTDIQQYLCSQEQSPWSPLAMSAPSWALSVPGAELLVPSVMPKRRN
jgi:2-polyprenyl-3-methyl-5-hydroxy-6-metoxy-1,4-benzoquinol methylase